MGILYHLQVGCANLTIIKAFSGTILIDCFNMERYKSLLSANKFIKAVFITHQHYDHFLGLKYLRDNNFTIEYIICSPYVRRSGDGSVQYEEWRDFEKLLAYFKRMGTAVIAPFRQESLNLPWWYIDNLSFRILGPAKFIAESESRELHDASLVILVTLGVRKCCFTGDASDKSLNWIAENTINYCNDILHASNHGSLYGANLEFIKGANASYTIISTESGLYKEVPHPIALKRYYEYTKVKVHRTDLDGTVEMYY